MLVSQASIEFEHGRQGRNNVYRKANELASLMEEAVRINDPTINSVLYDVATVSGNHLQTSDDLREYISVLAIRMRNATTSPSEDLVLMRDFSVQLTRQICYRVLSNRKPVNSKRHLAA